MSESAKSPVETVGLHANDARSAIGTVSADAAVRRIGPRRGSSRTYRSAKPADRVAIPDLRVAGVGVLSPAPRRAGQGNRPNRRNPTEGSLREPYRG